MDFGVAARHVGGSDLKCATAGKPDCYGIVLHPLIVPTLRVVMQ
jgi:hypothetical protein